MPLVQMIERQHGELFGCLDRLEALVGTRACRDETLSALEDVRHALLAHERTAERFVVVPLSQQHLLDTGQLGSLRAEADDLAGEAARLLGQDPPPEVLAAFIEAARAHIEREARIIVPVARGALDAGRLHAVPAWCVEEVYGGGAWPEQWLG